MQQVRLAFRRAIALRLLSDLALWLEGQDYAMGVSEFCPRTLTPRNVLITARR